MVFLIKLYSIIFQASCKDQKSSRSQVEDGKILTKPSEQTGGRSAWLSKMKHVNHETSAVRPAIIQFVFYFLNTVQGLLALLVLIFLGITNKNNIPSAFAIQGLFLMVYFANAMDIFGSFFGMIVALQLEIYHGPVVNPEFLRKAKLAPTLKCCSRKGQEDKGDLENLEGILDGMHRKKLGRGKSKVGPEPSLSVPRISSKHANDLGKPHHLFTKDKANHHTTNVNADEHEHEYHHEHEHHREHEHEHDHRREHDYQHHHENEITGTTEILVDPKGNKVLSEKGKPIPFFCFLCEKCFQPGKSRSFVNTLGYASWILLQSAWFLNIFFTAYYTWLGYLSEQYRLEAARCEVLPPTEACYDFNWTYFSLLMVVGVTFVLRNIFVFIIGMGFSERYLKRCQSNNPNDELPTSCSDTDIDFKKVPKQILYPYLMSDGKYPYIVPGTEKKKKRRKPTEMSKLVETSRRHHKKGEKEKRQRRILSAHEREIAKMALGFKNIRRSQVPLPVPGRRRRIYIPIITGVPDTIQLPPDLMTTKAHAWLTESEPDATASEMGESLRLRKVKRRKATLDKASLILLHDPGSKTNIPIDELIESKVEDLHDRLSTEESWSDDAFFEKRPGYDGDGDSSDGGTERETYMTLMDLQRRNWVDSDDEKREKMKHIKRRPSAYKK